MKRHRQRRQWIAAGVLSLLVGVGTFIACDGTIYDDLSADCPGCATYSVRFSYTKNVLYADAFAHYVKQVTLCAFDDTGLLVYTQTADSASLADNDQSMDVEDMPRGTYTLLAWAEGDGATDLSTGSTIDCYEYASLVVGQTTLDECTARLQRTNDTVDHNLTPLFHGLVENADLEERERGDDALVDMDLTCDTNHLVVVLMDYNGGSLDVDDFDFSVTSDNGLLDYDNSVISEAELTYLPWIESDSLLYDDDTSAGLRTRASLSAAKAELTLNRLTTDVDTRLHVYNANTGDEVLSIPLVDFVLYIREYYSSSSDQDYLDRQSSFTMTFFLINNSDSSGDSGSDDGGDDDGGNYSWMDAYIYINSWVVHLQDISL